MIEILMKGMLTRCDVSNFSRVSWTFNLERNSIQRQTITLVRSIQERRREKKISKETWSLDKLFCKVKFCNEEHYWCVFFSHTSYARQAHYYQLQCILLVMPFALFGNLIETILKTLKKGERLIQKRTLHKLKHYLLYLL